MSQFVSGVVQYRFVLAVLIIVSVRAVMAAADGSWGLGLLAPAVALGLLTKRQVARLVAVAFFGVQGLFVLITGAVLVLTPNSRFRFLEVPAPYGVPLVLVAVTVALALVVACAGALLRPEVIALFRPEERSMNGPTAEPNPALQRTPFGRR